MVRQTDSDGRPHGTNIAVDCTAEYLIQIGILQGDLNLTVCVEPPSPDDDAPLAAAERRLARSLLYRWRAEADAWDMTDPEPLPVRWTPSRQVRSPGEHVPAGSGADTIAGTFLGLPPRRRLVVLGTAGSGKTVLSVLLTLELLARRLTQGEDGVPVPLVLSLESWDARRQSLTEWLVDRLRQDHPGLPPVDGVHPARRLVLERRVLPVLDGLDELPEHRRAEVLDALNAGLGGDGDAVLVSRTDEYARLDQDGKGLRHATVIESLPLRPDEVAHYLRRARPPARAAAWAPLLETLRKEPAAPAARALSSPLMVWLVRRSYERHPAGPGELADRERFPTRDAVEAHLLDRIVPASFPPLPANPGRLHPPRTWDAERAGAWLSYLAQLLSRREESELAWWRLHMAPLPRLLALPALLATGIVLSFVIKAGMSGYAKASPLGDVSVTYAVTGGVVFAAVARSVTASWFGQRLSEPRRSANPLLFIQALRSLDRHARVGPQVRLAALTGGPVLVVLLLALYVFAGRDPALVWFSVGGVLPVLLMIVYAAPADTVDAATPDELLRGEQSALITTLTLVAPLIGAGAGAFFWLNGGSGGWETAVGSWAGASATLVLLSPWSRWTLARCSLAATGRAPWPLMTFLRDARTAGLLQVSGGTYRFRNRRLQEHLAGQRAQDRATAAAGPEPAPLPALADSPRFTVERTADHYRLRGRSRRLPLAHWTVLGTLMGVFVVRFSVSGQWQDPVTWLGLLVWPFIGALITVAGYLLPRRRMELELTRHGVTSVIGRRRCSYAWRHVEEITVRRAIVRGRDARFYALQVRLLAGAPRPPRRSRMGEGWFFVLPLGLSSRVDPQLAAALADFAGSRWTWPTGGR
ncbi:NACHT domain-containing protein [Streptomyces sp. FXJ1.172]|uniref:NACHT domain-containing protein n=1 Tax=Streptomyces sp. FXJ1.172 TaxID=710705 RepID=UPI0007CF8E90|nr:NACHT domain-containing protein [Streptomyces sp. FXJ1.172]WEO94270.1 NACHT domain-containing protein [Streptomyces sp. FXJ1.172]